MRSTLVVLLALVSCSRAPDIELPTCDGGVKLDAAGMHSMTIAADGRVTIDGVESAGDEDVEARLDRLAHAMKSDAELAQQLGLLHVPSEPLVVRIDRNARFRDAAKWLAYSMYRQRFHHLRLAVADLDTGEARFLSLDHPPMESGCRVFAPQSATEHPGGSFRLVGLGAASDARNDTEQTRARTWRILLWPNRDSHEELTLSSWIETRECLARFRATTCDYAAMGCLNTDASWQDAVSIVATAIELGASQFDFSSADAR